MGGKKKNNNDTTVEIVVELIKSYFTNYSDVLEAANAMVEEYGDDAPEKAIGYTPVFFGANFVSVDKARKRKYSLYAEERVSALAYAAFRSLVEYTGSTRCKIADLMEKAHSIEYVADPKGDKTAPLLIGAALAKKWRKINTDDGLYVSDAYLSEAEESNGEENDAKKLASGDQIGEYQGNIKTEEVKAVDKNDSTKKSDKSDKDKDKKSDQSNKSDSKDKKSSDSKSNSGSSSKSGTSSSSGSSGSSSSGSSGSSSSGSSGSSSGSSSSGSSSSGSSGSGSSPSTPAVHVHNWVAKTKTIHHDATGHYEDKWVQDSAAWDETVTTYTYEQHWFCADCGMMDPSEEHLEDHALSGGTGGSYTDSVEIPHTSTVHHDATGHNESVWVQDSAAWDETVTYYVCSGCGATQ